MDELASISTLAQRAQASEIRELLKLLDNQKIISFAGGIPEPSLFPVEEIKDAFQSVLGSPSSAAQALQYSISEGRLDLREWICEHMAAREVACSPANILIVNGSQQALDLIGRLLLDPGDPVLATRPTYLGAIQAFSSHSPLWRTLVPGQAGEASGGSKMAYVVPDFGNPDGQTWTREQRIDLLQAAERDSLFVVEDGAYAELGFNAPPPPPLLAEDVRWRGGIDRSHTLYCGTFSKTISPAFRVGWICAAERLIQKLVLLKQSSDLHTSTLNQAVLLRVLPAYRRVVAAARATYQARGQAMMAALDAHMPHSVEWTRPTGGLFTWLTLPEGCNGKDLLAAALLNGAAFVPGAPFFAVEPKRNTLRLSYSLSPPEAIDEGIRRIARTIRSLPVI
jgi:DNA-binding transcriptional MocR family regulator